MSILQTTELKKYYGAEPNITRALDGVTLSIEKGEFVAIVGTSGSGKSTLLNMIGGLDVPTSGKVIVDGRELSTLKDEQLTIFRRRKIGFMQSIGMTGKQLRRLTVYEGIYYAVGADIIGGAVAAILAVTVLKSALNGPSMWFFTLNITLVPVLVIGVLYLLLAAVIPLIVLHFFNKGTVVERLRTSE